MDLPLEWSFGAGRQATTLVTRVNPEFYVEHYATWYQATRSYGPTPRSGTAPSQSHGREAAEASFTKFLTPRPAFRGCFECHSTGAGVL